MLRLTIRLTIACVVMVPGIPSRAASVSIDGARQFQTIEGFGVNANHRSWNNNDLKPVLDALIDQGGMTLFRVIYDKTDWESINDNSDPNIPNWTYYDQVYSTPDFQRLWGMAAYLNQKGITDGLIFNFQGIGPDWLGGGSLTPGLEDEWAEMIGSLLIYARKTQHLQFSLVGPDNEADISVQGIDMTPAQYVTALRKLGQLLDTNGLSDVRFVGPDLASSSTSWLSTMMNDDAVMSRVAHFGLHSYSDGGSGSAGFYDFIQNSAYPDRTFWMTEFNVWCDSCESAQGGTNSWAYASAAARYLLYHLANGASAGIVWEGYDSQYNYYAPGQWSYWGLFGVDNINATSKTYSPRKIFYTLAQIAKFVRPGAKQIDLSGSSGSLLLVAFLHPVTGQLTISGANSGGETSFSAVLSNLPTFSHLDLYYTDSAKNLFHGQSTPVSNGNVTVTIPANCVFALTTLTNGPGQFVPTKALYSGLFYGADHTAPESSGFCSISTTAKGKFTAKLLLHGVHYSLSGRLDSNGHAHSTGKSITIDLQVGSSADVITGTVTDGAWTADLLAQRATFDAKTNRAPQSGQYTFILQGSPRSNTIPAGDSYGTLSVDKSGRVRVVCSFADGTRGTQSVPLASSGQIPLYFSLYGGQGFVSGWLSFNTNADTDLNGTVNWTKPGNSKTKIYPNGFSLQTSSLGSRYQRPAKGATVLNLTSAELVLSDGGLAEAITNQFSINSRDRISNADTNKLKLSFAPSTGVFKGSLIYPGLVQPLKLNGVVLQDQNVGRGFFLNANQSGDVIVRQNSSP